MPSCWIEVDLNAIGNNYRAIREIVGESVAIIAILKANAYGHGAVEVAKTLSQAGAEYLAVTRLEEAIPIREAGVLAPLMLLAPALSDEVFEVVAQDLTACIACFKDAEFLSRAAVAQKKITRVQLKIDTGMGRFGVAPQEAIEVARKIVALPNLQLEAAWTHFAFAAGVARDTPKVQQQFALFQPLIAQISQAAAISSGGFHCANSAAILRFPEMRLNCVRAGTILYGQMPSALAGEAASPLHLKLQNTFQAKTRVLAIKTIAPGQSVGYGGEWTARQPTKIATIGIGFADGFSQEPQTRRDSSVTALKKIARQTALQLLQMTGLKGEGASRTVQISNQKATIVGRIAMQSCAVDVTNIEGVQVGDEVLLSLRRTSAGAHLPRLYKF